MWRSGQISHPLASHVIDVDIETRQPPRAFVQTERSGTSFRANHRRPFTAQFEDGVFIVRDIHVLGPARATKAEAAVDKVDFQEAYCAGRENALFDVLRRKYASSVQIEFKQGEISHERLYSWEVEVECNSRHGRRARGVVRGDNLGARRRFTLQGKWQESRTKAHANLQCMLTAFDYGGVTAITANIAEQIGIAWPSPRQHIQSTATQPAMPGRPAREDVPVSASGSVASARAAPY